MRGRGCDRYDLALTHCLVQRVAKLVVRELLAVQVARQEILVRFDDRLDKLLPVIPDAVGIFLPNVGDRVLWPLEDLAVEKVDRRLQILVLADGHVEGDDTDAVSLTK